MAKSETPLRRASVVGIMNRTEVEKRGIVGNDSIFEGTRGRVGGTVFRLLNGVTVASARPRSPRTQSAAQKEGRGRFRLATAFARKELMDPLRRAFYEEMFARNPKKLRNTYTAAITYYLNNVHVKASNLDATPQKIETVKADLPKRNGTVKCKRASRLSFPISMKSRPPIKRNEPFDFSSELRTPSRFQGQSSFGHHKYIESG